MKCSKNTQNGMEWVPMPPFGLILCENVPTGVRMPMECLPDQKTKFFSIFPGFLGPLGGAPWGPPIFPIFALLLRCGEHLRCSLP